MLNHNVTSLRYIWSAYMQRLCIVGGSVVLLLSLFLTVPVEAQTAEDALRFSTQLPGSGARLTGLAGAGVAGVADVGALYTNPAGLGYLQRSQVAGGFNILGVQDDARYEPPALDGRDPQVTTNAQQVTDYGLGNAGLAYRFPTQRGSLVLAGGVHQTATFERTLEYVGENGANSITDTFLPRPGNFQVGSDGELSFDFDEPLRAFNAGAIEFLSDEYEAGEYPFIQAIAPGTTIEQADEVIEEGRITEASFGGAVEAAQGVMVGASLNLAYGTYRYLRFYRELDFNNENTSDLYEVAVDGGFLRGFDQLDVEERITSDLVGVSLRGGFAADVTSNLRAGLVLQTPTWYSVSETFGTRVTTFFDDGGVLDDGELGANEFDYSVRTPWRLGTGAALQLGRLRVTGDLEFVDWTQLRLRADAADFTDINNQFRDFSAVVNRRVGAEYRFEALTVRGGIAYHPDPRDAEIQLPGDETTDRAKTFYAAGFSYQFDPRFRFDFGWRQERFDDQFRPYPSVRVPGENVDIVAPYVDEELVRNQFIVGITYAF